MRRQHPQLTDTGLQGVRAFDVIDQLASMTISVIRLRRSVPVGTGLPGGASPPQYRHRAPRPTIPRYTGRCDACFRQYPFATLRLGHVEHERSSA